MKRNASLDSLRGVAVLLVIASHYPYFSWMTVGWFGVDLFFVLSGFLISGLLFSDLQQHGGVALGRFYLRRGFKIYPAFYVFLGITACIWPALRPHVVIESVFLQNYFLPVVKEFPQRGWSHLWSLAVEEHFYIALPLLLIALNKARRLHLISRIAAALLAFCLCNRVITALTYSHWGWARIFRTDLRIDTLFLGVALGYLHSYFPDRFCALSRWWLLPLGCLLLAPALLNGGYPSSLWSFSLLPLFNGLGFSAILCWAFHRKVRMPVLEFIGRHSYSIYLWHTVVMLYFLARPMSAVNFCSNIFGAIVIGVVMARLVEFPTLKLRNRLEALSALSENRSAPAPS